ncbi:POK19 protein, partial [Tyrannus savana]|nr:POK19 protein [Tyrannus savana]
QHQRIEQKIMRSEVPVKGDTVFTDAGKKSKRAAITWNAGGNWQSQLLPGVLGDSLQTLELRAVVWVFQQWQDAPVNIVSDSLYVVGTVVRIEGAMIKMVKNDRLHSLLL